MLEDNLIKKIELLEILVEGFFANRQVFAYIVHGHSFDAAALE